LLKSDSERYTDGTLSQDDQKILKIPNTVGLCIMYIPQPVSNISIPSQYADVTLLACISRAYI